MRLEVCVVETLSQYKNAYSVFAPLINIASLFYVAKNIANFCIKAAVKKQFGFSTMQKTSLLSLFLFVLNRPQNCHASIDQAILSCGKH